MQLFIIRHADPDYSIDDLTKDGHLEAAALGNKMKKVGLDELYASSMGRAQTTATYISESTGLPIKTEDWARELENWVTKLPSGQQIVAWDYPAEFIDERKTDLTEWQRAEDYWLKHPDNMKSYNNLVVASDKFLERQGLVRQGGVYKMTNKTVERKKIAMVCHGGFGLTWLAHLLHLPLSFVWQGFWLPPSSVTTVLFEKRETDYVVPRCIRLSDVSHLEESGLPVKTGGLLATNYDSL